MTKLGRLDNTAGLPGAWDHSVLQLLVDINLHVLAALVGTASNRAAAVESPLISLLRADWLQLTPERQARLAHCPYLLLDPGFSLPGLRATLVEAGVRDEPASRMPAGRLGAVLGPEIVRRMLVLVWHLARSNPLAARIALGVSGPCVELLAAVRLTDLERLAETRPSWIRLRWEDHPEIWRQLLEAAASDHEVRLRTLQLRGLQLLAGGMLTRLD